MSIVSLSEAKTFLSKSSSADDTQLTTLLDVVSEVCERFTRKSWESATVTAEVHDGGGEYLYLLRTPVTSVTSVTESGTAVTDFVLDKRRGVVRRGTYTSAGSWQSGFQNVSVTYVTGPLDGVPDRIKQGCLLLLQHMWDTQRGGSNLPRQGGADGEYNPALGFYLPNRVREAWGEPRILVR